VVTGAVAASCVYVLERWQWTCLRLEGVVMLIHHHVRFETTAGGVVAVSCVYVLERWW
jgi:hypothetical protein